MKIIILCGGHGTRLWPISRQSFPKPFVPLINGKSFVQITYSRFRKIFSPEDIFISTEDRYLPFVRRQIPEAPRENIILEPERRDTMAAYGLATAFVNKKHPDEPIMFSWAKHVVKDEPRFLKAVVVAGEYCKSTGLGVSIDSKADFPSVNNGWIKKGEKITNTNGTKIFELERQVEKPEKKLAEEFYNSGEWLIHTGYKVWNSKTLLGYFEKYQPETYKCLMKITSTIGKKDYMKTLRQQYSKIEKNSIDYGIFEKLPKGSLVTIEADIGWLDVGISWETFYKAFAQSKENVVEGGADFASIDAEKNLVIAPKGKVVGVIGVENLAIIDTSDGLLITKIDESQTVKDLYKKIEEIDKDYVE